MSLFSKLASIFVTIIVFCSVLPTTTIFSFAQDSNQTITSSQESEGKNNFNYGNRFLRWRVNNGLVFRSENDEARIGARLLLEFNQDDTKGMKWRLDNKKIIGIGDLCLDANSSNILVLSDCTSLNNDWYFDSLGRMVAVKISDKTTVKCVQGQVAGEDIELTLSTCNNQITQLFELEGTAASTKIEDITGIKISTSLNQSNTTINPITDTTQQQPIQNTVVTQPVISPIIPPARNIIPSVPTSPTIPNQSSSNIQPKVTIPELPKSVSNTTPVTSPTIPNPNLPSTNSSNNSNQEGPVFPKEILQPNFTPTNSSTPTSTTTPKISASNTIPANNTTVVKSDSTVKPNDPALPNINSVNNNVPPTTTTTPVIEKQSTTNCVTLLARNWVDGTTSEEVKELQECLRKEGTFNFVNNTGFYGPITKKALEDYKSKQKPTLPTVATTPANSVAPVVSPTTQPAVSTVVAAIPKIEKSSITNILTKKYSIGDQSDDIEVLQKYLKQEGFYNYGFITGYFGDITKKALDDYNLANNKTTVTTPVQPVVIPSTTTASTPTTPTTPVQANKTNFESLSQAFATESDLSTLASSIDKTGLIGSIGVINPATILAPTNEAFQKLDKNVLAQLQDPKNIDLLKMLISYHVIPERLTSAGVVAGTSLKTLNGASIPVDSTSGTLNGVTSFAFGKKDLQVGDNVTIHKINTVLIPKGFLEAVPLSSTPVTSPKNTVISPAPARIPVTTPANSVNNPSQTQQNSSPSSQQRNPASIQPQPVRSQDSNQKEQELSIPAIPILIGKSFGTPDKTSSGIGGEEPVKLPAVKLISTDGVLQTTTNLDSQDRLTENKGLKISSPTEKSLLKGVQVFQADYAGIDEKDYDIFWQVEDGQMNKMENSIDRKQSFVDLKDWNWKKDGVYNITFTTLQNGSELSKKTIQISTSVV
jgi:uncharacterized surface protein with fasciclin (FAS1) repeats